MDSITKDIEIFNNCKNYDNDTENIKLLFYYKKHIK